MTTLVVFTKRFFLQASNPDYYAAIRLPMALDIVEVLLLNHDQLLFFKKQNVPLTQPFNAFFPSQ